jgi:hypothetical protein
MRILPLNPKKKRKGKEKKKEKRKEGEKEEGKKKKKRNFNNASKKNSFPKLHSVRVPKTELYPRSMEKDYLYMIQLLIKRKRKGKEKEKKREKKGKKKKKRKKKRIIMHQRKSLSQTSLCQGPQEHANAPFM